MKTPKITVSLVAITAAAFISGCETTDSGSSASNAKTTTTAAVTTSSMPTRYKATDGRDIEIGRSKNDDGGLRFNEPHMEKNKCWIADGFNFKGYQALYIAPIVPNTKIHDDEKPIQDIAITNLTAELKRSFAEKGFFPKITTVASDIAPGSKALTLTMTITEYSKGGGAARYFVGLYGGGQPVLRVHGVMTDADKKVFDFEIRRSGASASGRLAGGVMRDEDVQMGDVRSLVIDLTDFIGAISGKYSPEN